MITTKDAAILVKLLGELQLHLESAIESSTVEGEMKPREPWLRPLIKRDRKMWRIAEEMVARLNVLATDENSVSRKPEH